MGASVSVAHSFNQKLQSKAPSSRSPKENIPVKRKSTAKLANDDLRKSSKIDSFVQEVYQSISCFESLDNIILSKSGEEALLRFLRQEYCEENLQFYLDVEAAKQGASRDMTKLDTKHLLDTYLSFESPSEVNISASLKTRITLLISQNDNSNDSVENDDHQKELILSLESAQAEVKAVLALGALPRFFISPIFAKWRDGEILEGNIRLVRSSSSDGPHKEEEEPELEPIQERLQSVLSQNKWLRSLLASLENIPVCVSLASASRDIQGFPLIYVNKSFEKSTGYLRGEIIGKNCRFLQTGIDGAHSEEESISKLTKALALGKPVKVSITNFRKDGTPFNNLLAVKPIFDDRGDYAFVVGMQFDTGQDDATPEKLKLLDTFFELLPDTIMCSQEGKYPVLRQPVYTSDRNSSAENSKRNQYDEKDRG